MELAQEQLDHSLEAIAAKYQADEEAYKEQYLETVKLFDVYKGDQVEKGKKSVSEPVTVDSRSADLNYGGNKLAFAGNVAVRGRGMKLDSDKLDIDLKSEKTAAGKNRFQASSVPAPEHCS